MTKTQKNCTQEMEKLFKEHFPMLCLIAFGIVKDKDTAKDIVQEFYISYWQRRETVSITISFKAYAIRAVKNLSLQSLDKAKKEGKVLIKRKDGSLFELKALLKNKSPLDVKGINLSLKKEDIIDILREVRER